MLTGALLGLGVGAVMALTGAGGGILAVPLLVFGLGLGVAQAAPAAMLAVALAATLGAVLGLRAGIVRYRAAGLIAAAGVPLSPLGLWLGRRIAPDLLALAFAALLVYVGVRTWRRAQAALRGEARPPAADLPCVRDAASGRFIWTTRCARALAGAGAFAGLMSGLLGVSGGFLVVPSLQRYTDLDMRSVVATTLAVTALLTAVGAASSALAGTLDFKLALPFAGGALAGLLAGRRAARRVAGPRIQQGFAVLCAAVALGMAVRALA